MNERIQCENGKQTDVGAVYRIRKTEIKGQKNKEETISMDFAAPD